MRKDEGEQVVSTFRDTFKVPLVAVDAERRFLEKLRGVVEPEAKRKAIGAEFIRVFEEEAAKIAAADGDQDGAVRFLVQGTLYSDVIESGGGTGAAPALPGARPGDQDRRRRSDEGASGRAARGRPHPPGRDPPRRPLPRAVAVILRAARRAHGGRAGRRAHVRLRGGRAGGDQRRRDDRGLGAAAL